MGMAVKVVPHHVRPRGCVGKVPYRTLDAAQEALLRVVARFATGEAVDNNPERPLCVYECATCSCWHLGHQPVDPKDRT